MRVEHAMGRPVDTIASLDAIGRQIVVLRGQKVLLDATLASLYHVSTKRLNEQVRRNRRRFPSDFMFRMNDQELINLRSQFATSSSGRSAWGGRRHLPYAFTEHGALMAANVLNSRRAIDVAVYVVRAFVRLRDILAEHKELARKLNDLERQTEQLASKHDALSTETRAQFKQVIEALRQLMSAPPKSGRAIGFITPK
jgi:hypothetical protein